MWESLWRGTVTLAREYPALWLPVIFAELMVFALRTSKLPAIVFVGHLLSRMFPGHSVLIGSVGSGDSSTLGFAYVAAVLIAFVIQSAPVVLYTIAFFLTARMVSERVGLREPVERTGTGSKIVALSIRGLLVGFAVEIAVAIVSLVVVRSRWHVVGLPWTIFTDVMSAVTMSVFAYVMVPPALRLLADSAESLDELSIRLGRKCALAAVVASVGLIILEHLVIGIIHGSHAEIVTIWTIASVIAALPYAPLYIALSLLARGERAKVSEENTALLV